MLPLLAAFINANLQFNKLTKQSLFNMSQAVETTRSSQILLEELAIMERSARQYFVLHDKALLSNYLNAHDRFNKAILTLAQQPLTKPQQTELQIFAQQESLLFITINHASENAEFDANMVNAFSKLTTQANQIIEENNQLIDNESNLFRTKVTEVKKALFWQMLTIFPLVIIIAALITWMIARPIRRMDAAINQLGKGDYEHIIEINGPGDLRQLGQRLDWLRTALKDLHQQKQRFLQQASHELKTPLTAIREASELLNDGIAGPLSVQQNQIVSILRENSLRLQKMIENLLKYTEMQFNSSKLNPSQQVLADVINKVMQSYSLSIAHKKIVVHKQIDNILLQIDTEKLFTILDNLISNAVKFTPEAGEITIRAVESKPIATNAVNSKPIAIIEVIDTGPGISEENKNKLFSPFYHGEQPKYSLVSSSGLGLFIAKEAVDLLKGELSLMPSNTGAHFLLKLPLIPTHPYLT